MKLLLVLSVAALVVAACGDDDERPAVTGTVTAPDGAPPVDRLPTDAQLTITLQDVSRADAPSLVIATQTTDLGDGGFPVAFELPYDLGDIVETNTYSVGARVDSGGDLLMISDTIVPAITRGAPTGGIVVELVYLAAG